MSEPARILETTTPPAPEPPHGRPPAEHGFWPTVREALRGSHQDYTEGAIGRSIVLLAIPMVLEMAMESIFAVTDIFFVSRLGEASIATVALTESLLALVYALAMGLGIGATALVARRVGERDRDGAANAAVQALALALGISVVLGTLGALAAPRLLALMGAAPEVVAVGAGYTRVMLGGQAAILVLFVANAIFRGAGDAAIAMRVLWIANSINIVLGPLLIFGVGPLPRLGVTGAAIATTIGRATGALIALSKLGGHNAHVSVSRRHLRLDPHVMRQILGLSATATLQMLVGTASWIGLVRIVSTFGTGALAGYAIGIRVIVFALLPSFGLSNAAATMVGQALGARKPERAERAVWTAGHYNAAFLLATGLLFVGLAPSIVAIFTTDPAVAPFAIDCLRITALGFPLYAYGMVFTTSFNGAGDTWTPTWLNLVVFWLWEIPLAWTLAVPLGMGPHGAFLAITIAFSTLALASGVLFRRGRWKTRRL